MDEDRKVEKKGHTEEQILRALRQAEGGTRVADICREHGISEATFEPEETSSPVDLGCQILAKCAFFTRPMTLVAGG